MTMFLIQIHIAMSQFDLWLIALAVDIIAYTILTWVEEKHHDPLSLSDDEIESMINDAKENEEKDKAKRDLIQAKNNLDSLLYSATKLVNENSSKLSEETAQSINSEIDIAREALDSDDVSLIGSAQSSLEAVLHTAGSELYSSADEDTEADEGFTSGDTIDAEFREAASK